jgi:hypothetical protein
MSSDLEKSELSRLHKQQAKTRHDEVFGGLSPAEHSAYENRQVRIRELENDLSVRPGKLELLT